jgi:uncharacterized protein with HEPN domain
MSSKHDPRASLHDIVENAKRAIRYVADIDRDTFEKTDLLRDAVERCIERVCEAVYRLGTDAEALMPGQPWAQIRGMANRLRHAYDRIEVDRVWETAKSDLPELQAAAAAALARLIAEQGAPNITGAEGKDRPT